MRDYTMGWSCVADRGGSVRPRLYFFGRVLQNGLGGSFGCCGQLSEEGDNKQSKGR